jgi:hypothetical protein
MRAAGATAALLLGLAAATGALAQTPRMIKVAVEFRQTGATSRDAAGASGRVVITERGSVRPQGGIALDSSQTRVRQSTGIFTLVQDGGESTLVVATQVPHQHVAYWYDYARGLGYVATGVTFRDVGASLKVRAALLPGGQVRVRLTPSLSYLSPDGGGAIELTEATTELVVPSGRPVTLGGATQQTHATLRQVLGYAAGSESRETLLTLTATVQ